MEYGIVIKDIEPIRVAMMRYEGPVVEAKKYFPGVFKSIGGKSTGAPFFCFHQVDLTNGFGVMELCVPTGEIPAGQGVEAKTFPRINGLCLTHYGSYENLPVSYQRLHGFIAAKEISVGRPWREVYIKGPGMLLRGNPSKYITEIIFPINKE
jgi:effector-binding domain-containing protein